MRTVPRVLLSTQSTTAKRMAQASHVAWSSGRPMIAPRAAACPAVHATAKSSSGTAPASALSASHQKSDPPPN
eukprot:8269653-Alexandrium_andersonii.AAC.1